MHQAFSNLHVLWDFWVSWSKQAGKVFSSSVKNRWPSAKTDRWEKSELFRSVLIQLLVDNLRRHMWLRKKPNFRNLLTVSKFLVTIIHMIIAPAYASVCITTSQNGSNFHLRGIASWCFWLLSHDSLYWYLPDVEYIVKRIKRTTKQRVRRLFGRKLRVYVFLYPGSLLYDYDLIQWCSDRDCCQ